MRNRRRAFTLMELILSTAMVAMLSMALYMAFATALRARDTAVRNVTPVRNAAIAADLIRQDLESVMAPTGLLAREFIGTRQAAGAGEFGTLQFCSVGADATNRDEPMSEGIRQIELTVRTDVTPAVLVRRITRNLLPASSAEEPEEEILCKDVRSFTIRYFDGTSWLETWDSTTLNNVLPYAVEMVLELEYPRRDQEPGVYKITRVVPLACAKSPDDAATGGTQ